MSLKDSQEENNCDKEKILTTLMQYGVSYNYIALLLHIQACCAPTCFYTWQSSDPLIANHCCLALNLFEMTVFSHILHSRGCIVVLQRVTKFTLSLYIKMFLLAIRQVK